MAKNKVSEWNTTASNNTDVGGINIAEGCAPSGINNAIRELMAQIKDMQTGADGDGLVVGGTFTASGGAVLSGTVTAPTPTTGDSSTKVATTAFVSSSVSGSLPSGVIVIWSGASSAVPSGWYLCNGANGTPDLRDRFVVGAGSTYSVGNTGGSKDAIVVSHSHSVSDPGHTHTIFNGANLNSNVTNGGVAGTVTRGSSYSNETNSSNTGISINSTGASGTNANLPPYYALCYIMKA